MKTLILTTLVATLALGYAYIDEKRLTEYLVEQYKRIGVLGRPVAKQSDVWNITIGLSLVNILDVDFQSQTIEAILWNQLGWNDVLLTWSKDDFPVKLIRVRPSDVSMPDITAYNAASPAEDLMKNPLILVDNKGAALYIPPIRQRFTCPMEKDADTITCSLKYGSWTYDGYHVDLQLPSNVISLDAYTSNPDWLLVKTSASRHVTFYECCPEPYIAAAFNITLKRR